jgi:hypothetical protein
MRGEGTPNFNRKCIPGNPPRRTNVDPQRLVQRVVERGIMVSKLLPQRLLGLGLVKVGRRHASELLLLLRASNGAIWGREGGTR